MSTPHPNRKLTTAEVVRIRRWWKLRMTISTVKAMARRHNLSTCVLRRVATGEYYKEIPYDA